MGNRIVGSLIGGAIGFLLGAGTGIVGGAFGAIAGVAVFTVIGALVFGEVIDVWVIGAGWGWSAGPDLAQFVRRWRRK